MILATRSENEEKDFPTDGHLSNLIALAFKYGVNNQSSPIGYLSRIYFFGGVLGDKSVGFESK